MSDAPIPCDTDLTNFSSIYFSSGFKLKAPAGTPRSLDPKELADAAAKKQMKIVEVQEVFDVNDLNSTWDNTFVPKQCMVWVPNPKYKRKVTEEQM